MMKLLVTFEVLDPKTDDVVLGLRNIPSDHAQLLMLAPEVPLSELAAGAYTYATARRETYKIRRII